MKPLGKVPDRYRDLFEHLFDHYADHIRSLTHEREGAVVHGAVVLDVDFDREHTVTWHFVTNGSCEITEGEPEGEHPRLLHVRVNAEKLRTAMEVHRTMREVAIASGAQVRGDIDFAFKTLAAAERVRDGMHKREDEPCRS